MAFFGARAGALLVAYVCRDFFGRFSTTSERFWTFFLWVAKLPMRATFAERPMCVCARRRRLWVPLFRWVRGAATSARSDAAAVVGWCALLSGATLRLRIPPTARVQSSPLVAL